MFALSRELLAVPFMGKDVPSRNSEFAHPEVLIGLTILAYRYEGLRKRDMLTIIKWSSMQHAWFVNNPPHDTIQLNRS